MRTVQRWEQVSGLPVRRVGSPGGEMVFAFTREIDEWLRSDAAARRDAHPLEPEADSGQPACGDPASVTPVPSDHPARSYRRMAWRFGTAAVLALAAIAAVMASRSRPAPAPAATAEPQPARWDATDRSIRFSTLEGAFMCEVKFDEPVNIEEYRDTPPGRRLALELRGTSQTIDEGRRKVDIADLDGDGTRELLVIVAAANRSHQVLRVFDSQCRERWHRDAQPTITFGATDFPPPFMMQSLLVTDAGDGGRQVWLSRRHDQHFPSVLERYGARGQLLGEFWHAGEILAVNAGTVGGRPIVAIGGVNNERRLPFVGIFDAADTNGYGPAESEKFRCSSPRVHPARLVAYVLLPDSTVGKAALGMRAVSAIELHPDGMTAISIQNSFLDANPPIVPSISFEFDARFSPIHVELTDSYRAGFAWLFRRDQGRRVFDPEEGPRMRASAQAWDGQRFLGGTPAGTGPSHASSGDARPVDKRPLH